MRITEFLTLKCYKIIVKHILEYKKLYKNCLRPPLVSLKTVLKNVMPYSCWLINILCSIKKHVPMQLFPAHFMLAAYFLVSTAINESYDFSLILFIHLTALTAARYLAIKENSIRPGHFCKFQCRGKIH